MGIAAALDVIARELLLFAATGLFVGGLDDLVIDLLFLGRVAWRRGARIPLVETLPSPGPARVAVVVAAWREAAVIGTMLRAALARFRHDDFLIFVAVYPNDRDTVDTVARVAEGDPRLRVVVNPRAGPTTKADNLNAAWRALEREEVASGRRLPPC